MEQLYPRNYNTLWITPIVLSALRGITIGLSWYFNLIFTGEAKKKRASSRDARHGSTKLV